MGWNPCQKLFPRSKKKNNGFVEVLNRHKTYLRQLEDHKNMERNQVEYLVKEEEDKKKTFMDKA